MKISIEGTPQEIAALVLAVQERPDKNNEYDVREVAQRISSLMSRSRGNSLNSISDVKEMDSK